MKAKDRQITVRFTDEDFEKIQAVAESCRMSPGAYIRGAAIMAMKSEMTQEDFESIPQQSEGRLDLLEKRLQILEQELKAVKKH